MPKGKRTVRSSEIGTYLYCERSWWYQRQGYSSKNRAEMDGGTAFHQEHAAQARGVLIRQVLGYLFFLAAVVILLYFLLQSII